MEQASKHTQLGFGPGDLKFQRLSPRVMAPELKRGLLHHRKKNKIGGLGVADIYSAVALIYNSAMQVLKNDEALDSLRC